MNFEKSKTKATLAAFLVLTFAVTLLALPITNAHTPPWTIPTYAFVTVSPKTIGLGQHTTIVMWVNIDPPTATGVGGDRWHNYMINITKPDGKLVQLGPFTSDQIGSSWTTYTPDVTGDYSIVFSWPGQTLTNGTGEPNTRGFPYVGDWFEGATSDPATLHVQQEPPAEWVEPPLPTDYWTRPLTVQNRGWAQLASNYLKGSWLRNMHFQEEGQAPNSAHILWTKAIYQYGGIADARYGAVKVGAKDYEYFMPAPIIMLGKIYYNAYAYPWYGYYCVDLKTGETTWYKNGTDNGLNNPVTYGTNGSTNQLEQIFPVLDFGQLYSYYGVNGAGVIPYLWMTQLNTPQTATSGGQMWYMLDANTGNWILSLKNVPTGTYATDEQGDELIYSYNPTTGNFLAWNSSQSIPPGNPTGTGQQQWKPRTGAVIDALNDTSWTQLGATALTGVPGTAPLVTASDILPRSGYTMNVTGPKGLPSKYMAVLQDKNMVPKEIALWDYGPIEAYPYPMANTQNWLNMAVVRIDDHVASYSPFPDKSATQNNNLGFGVTLLWNKNITYPIATGNLTFYMGTSTTGMWANSERTTVTGGKGYMISYDDQVFCLWCKELRQYWGYSLTDGSLLWGPTARTDAWDYYGFGGYCQDTPGTIGYGMLFNAGYAGELVAYNVTTGKQLWNHTAPSIGHESPYGNYPLLVATIADGKLYVVTGEHSATQPMWRGAYIRCINATDGTEMWKLQHFVMNNNDHWLSIADGYIVAANDYDGQLYCIGKGPSATTVEAPMTAITAGTSAVIHGTVTDQSAGATLKTVKALFPNGLPCVSDDSMEAWMEYVYMQQAMPTNATGVEVTVDAVDPNNNFIHIGTATSDISGTFGYAWTPPDVPGKYTIIATFQGSNSYGASYAETYAVVSQAPAATPTPTPLTLPPYETYTIGAAIAIIIAIAIVGILLLRRRP